MTSLCPDWAALARRREQVERSPEVGGATVDGAWKDALRHREGCGRCRAASLDADPLMLLCGDAAGGEDEDLGAVEVDAVRRRVRLELEARAMERRLNMARSARRRLPVASALAAGAAAAALGASLLLWPKTAPPADDIAGGAPMLPDHIAMAPLVEPLGDAPMQVYQLPGSGRASGLDVVLVVAP